MYPAARDHPVKMPKAKLAALSILAAGGGALFGYDIGIVSGALVQLKNVFKLSCFHQEMVVSSMLMGALFGSLVGGFFIDKFGRKLSILIASTMYFIGGIELALSSSYATIIFGRVLLGFAMALAGTAECIYTSELAPQKIRGSLVSLNEFGITVGIVLSYLINFAFSADAAKGWRYMFGLSSIGACVMFISVILLPQSPRFLLIKGKAEQAKSALLSIRIKTNDSDEVMISQEFARMDKNISIQNEARCSLFCQKSTKYAIIIAVGLVVSQQCTGEPNVLFYANTILLGMGFHDEEVASLVTVGLGAAKVVATILCLVLIDRLGRRFFLICGCLLMFLSLIGISVVAFQYNVQGKIICSDNSTVVVAADIASATIYPNVTSVTSPSLQLLENNNSLKWLAWILLILLIFSYSLSFGPVTWIVLSEIFPAQIRGSMFSLAITLNWTMNLIISSTFLGFVERSGGLGWPFFVSTLFGAVSLAFVFFVIPETKGKSLEEIIAILDKGIPYKRRLHTCCFFSQRNSAFTPLISEESSSSS